MSKDLVASAEKWLCARLKEFQHANLYPELSADELAARIRESIAADRPFRIPTELRQQHLEWLEGFLAAWAAWEGMADVF